MPNKQRFQESVLMEFDSKDIPLGERVRTSSTVDQDTAIPVSGAELKALMSNFSGVSANDFVTFTKTSNGQLVTELSTSPLIDDSESVLIFNKQLPLTAAFEAELSISQRIRYDMQTMVMTQDPDTINLPQDIQITTIYQSTADTGVAYNTTAGTILTIVLANPFQGYLSDWIHVYGLVDNRLNYPNLAVKWISHDRKTITC